MYIYTTCEDYILKKTTDCPVKKKHLCFFFSISIWETVSPETTVGEPPGEATFGDFGGTWSWKDEIIAAGALMAYGVLVNVG